MFHKFPHGFKVVETAPGFLVRAVSGQSLMLCDVILQANSESPLHSHPYEEMGLILDGEFEMTIGDDTMPLTRGDIYLVPPDIIHGGITHEQKTLLVSAYSPPREDYK